MLLAKPAAVKMGQEILGGEGGGCAVGKWPAGVPTRRSTEFQAHRASGWR